jgi:iron(III) transport system ATP-binding protein
MASVKLTGIAKSFGAVRVLEAIDLEVRDGEFVALLGPSGCGKSTLIRIVAGLETADRGEVHLGGRKVNGSGLNVPPEERKLGMVFQSYAVWPHKTVRENVAYPLKIRRLPPAEISREVDRALELVRLGAFGNRYPHELSGGQQQRVALARALVAAPEVLLLDEPLSNLDARLREEMRGELRELSRRLKVTVILVTHDQAEALSTADRVAVMRAGRIVQLAPPEEVYARPADLYVAETVGTVNVLSLHSVQIEAGEITIEAQGGLRCRARGPHEPIPQQELVSWALAIRPEDVIIGEGDLELRVEARAFLGGRVELTLHGEGLTIRALVPA